MLLIVFTGVDPREQYVLIVFTGVDPREHYAVDCVYRSGYKRTLCC